MFPRERPWDRHPQKERGEGGTKQWKKSLKMLYYKDYTVIVENKEKQKEAKIPHGLNTAKLLTEKYVGHILRSMYI